MKRFLPIALAACLFAAPSAAEEATPGFHATFSQTAAHRHATADAAQELPPYLQCVPYARQVSGIPIYGDAHSWWDQAEGRFARGSAPRVGAVMAFAPYRGMELGHVATVARVLDSRTVLLDHANWSPIDGRRGQIEREAKAIDVSPANDWSAVRVWYDPLQALGRTAWPVHGFIYPDRTSVQAPRRTMAPARKETSRAFLTAFSDLTN
ncbi:CHAP domain-containing protein [Qipengyuania sp. MTN3-11]|uniref:CHAP domain-containing protein n=1 Tax=Qipengyuania sp. MTN3-11 TaxID=3056557 RepID=UPI0036F2602E